MRSPYQGCASHKFGNLEQKVGNCKYDREYAALCLSSAADADNPLTWHVSRERFSVCKHHLETFGHRQNMCCIVEASYCSTLLQVIKPC